MGKNSILVAFAIGTVELAACGGENGGAGTQAETSALKVVVKGKVDDVKIAAVVKETDLVTSDIDPGLVNAWGLAFPGASGPAWMSSNGMGQLALYDANGTPQAKVLVPPLDNSSTPTGLVFNASSTLFMGDRFIGVTEDGTVFGWQPPITTPAQIRVPAPMPPKENVYKGVALATIKGGKAARLFVADFHNNLVRVFDESYGKVKLHPGAFVDPHLPRGFAPFNIVLEGNLLFVSYAKQDGDAHDDVPGVGNGFVNVFELDGEFVQRLISNGVLNSPWGMAFMADPDHDHGKSKDYGKGKKDDDEMEVRLLVGNFADGFIHVYDLEREHGHFEVEFEGAIGDAPHHKLFIDGLWALVFGPGGGGFNANQLFFTAGPGGESEGLFGRLDFVQ